MRSDALPIKVRRLGLIFITCILAASCSKKSALNPETDTNTSEALREAKAESAQDKDEQQPDRDRIEEDCATFVRSTRVIPARTATNCPTCPAGGTPILAFRGMNTDAVSCSGDTCTVIATIHAAYIPGSGERVSGGLTGWLSPEQRSAYLNGKAPSGEQTYRVQIIYRRRDAGWRAVEFDRAPGG
jgi:hypothetical protein